MSLTSDEGRVQVSTSYPCSGTHSILLDDTTANAVWSNASVVLAIDASGQSNLGLDFSWRSFGNEDNEQDGVFLSDDLGRDVG